MGRLKGRSKKNNNLQKTVPADSNELPLARIIGIDFSRGWGLFIIIVTHAFNYWGVEYLMAQGSESSSGERPLILTILMFPFLWQGTWASAFSFFTGASVTYTMHYQIAEKNVNVNKRIVKTLINTLIIFIIHFIYTYLTIYPVRDITLEKTQGLIPASIKNGELSSPPLSIFFMAGPLTMILFSDLFITLTCYVLWRNGIDKKKNAHYRRVFVILGVLILYLAEPIKSIFIPIMNEQYAQGNYFNALILSWFVGPKQCIFPFVSFAYFAGALLLYLRDEKPNFQGLARYGYTSSLIFLVIAIISGIIVGFPWIDEWYGVYHPFFLYHINLAGEMIWLTASIRHWDMVPIKERKKLRRFQIILPFQRLSMISLTIFLFEEIFAALYSKLTELIFPISIYTNSIFIVFWTVFYTFVWITMINYWDKWHKFKFSVEWILACLMSNQKLGNNHDMLGLEKSIYFPLGYKNKEEFYTIKATRKGKKIEVYVPR